MALAPDETQSKIIGVGSDGETVYVSLYDDARGRRLTYFMTYGEAVRVSARILSEANNMIDRAPRAMRNAETGRFAYECPDLDQGA